MYIYMYIYIYRTVHHLYLPNDCNNMKFEVVNAVVYYFLVFPFLVFDRLSCEMASLWKNIRYLNI